MTDKHCRRELDLDLVMLSTTLDQNRGAGVVMSEQTSIDGYMGTIHIAKFAVQAFSSSLWHRKTL